MHLSLRRKLLVAGLVQVIVGHAQLSSIYTTTSSAGTYTPITGGTVLQQGTFDDAYSEVDVPSFFFGGNYYGTVFVSTNGFLTLGLEPLVTNYTPISGMGTYVGAISAFGTNLQNATSGTPEIRWQQVADELVFQWQDVRRVGGGAERFSCQARIALSTGIIRTQYSAVSGLSAIVTNQPEAGLRGPSNAFPSNVRNRRVATGTETWAAPLGGTAANNKVRFTSAAPAKSPAGGETFVFTPSCLSPVALSTVTTDCATSTYRVAVQITSLGSAAAADVVSSIGGVLFDDVPPGTYLCGPFPLGTAVTLSVVNSSSAACTNALGTFNPTPNCMSVSNGACLSEPWPAIPDDGAAQQVDLQAAIAISGMNPVLGSGAGQTFFESIDLIVAHTYRGDLRFRLTSPSGQTRDLLLQEPTSNASGSNFGNPNTCPGATVRLKDGAASLSTLDADNTNAAGTFAPEQPLAGFTGNANGTWILRVSDASPDDAGTLRYVRLRFRNVDCNAVIGGTATVGTACNDGNANTSNDTWGPNCVCAGTGGSTQLAVRALLEGPYDANADRMQDSLRSKNLLPLTEPYTALGFNTGTSAGANMPASALLTTGTNAIVDWVLVELRDATNSANVQQVRCALIQRDGDIVDVDGVSSLTLTGPGSWFIAVRHRNHLGAMTAAAFSLTNGLNTVDLSSPAQATYGTQARNTVGTRAVLVRGNVAPDAVIQYTGQNNDRDPILVRIGGTVPTAFATGYYPEDVNLDGLVKYTGADNDRDPILVNIGGTVPTNTRLEQLP